IYAIYRFMTRKSQGKRENRAFIKAAKQSKKRLKDRRKPSVSSLSSKKKPFRKRSAAHLTVIEGKKGKKKNRASS
ncbi:MAG TPA: hypothetical protein VEY51_10145, partial [Chondromyces sp.]|nr:hypothetical protein [Chondromyces sp.]